MMKSRFLIGFTAALLMCSLRVQAESETVPPDDVSGDALVIDGDKLELHLDRKMRALGNASITRGKQTILGDVIDYDVQNDELHVEGNARINVGNGNITGPELHMRLSEGIGEMKDASIILFKTPEPNATQDATNGSVPNNAATTSNNESIANVTLDNVNQNTATQDETITPKSLLSSSHSRGDAKAIFFEGQDKKRLLDARYTTCAAGVDDWYIKAKELVLNDYTESGVARNAYIEFKGVPFIYTPWISFSYNNQRKSGLLTPTMGSTSRSGFEVATPFYWNISPNMDATITPRELSKRGVQLQTEFRYLGDTFSGIDSLEYLPNDSQADATRYYANLKHQQTFSNGWSAGYSLEKVSDDQYFADLSTRIVTTSRINLPQQFNVDYTDDNWNFNALAQKFQTLDNLSFPYERLPQLTLIGNKEYGPVDANLYTQLVEFERNSNAPTVSTTGAPVPIGTRFTLYPSISLPMTQSYGYITPKFGVHYTNYSLNNIANNLQSQDRTLPIFSLDSGLFFDRNFKVASRDYSQTIEPRLYYVYIPDKKQSNIPIFDTSEADLNFSTLFSENQFTGNDRINNANQLSLAVTTRLIESSTGTQRLSASIGQRYYFADQVVALPGADFRKNNSSDIIAGLSANLKTNWNVDAFWQYNTDDARSVRTSLTSRYAPEPGKALNLGYSYRRDVAGSLVSTGIDQFDISAQWPLGQGWYGIGRINYSIQDKQFIETLAGIEYDAGCWQTRSVIQRVSTATANANYAFFFQLQLGGLASIGANPLNVIKRNVPGYVATGLIPDSYQQPYYE